MTANFPVIVQKFGGSSVADAKKIKQVASFIKSSLHDDLRICVVVSAMGHTTNELINLAHQVCNDPPKRELDMLTSCGERSSMALLAMALHDIGVRAMSLTGSQSGIITDEHHSGAEIIEIKPNRVHDAFFMHQVVIVAGFQGMSLKREITTLRRGGSDTTAVAMAAALNAQCCEIYTDVKGVMDADPRIIENALVLPTITFDQMEAMALYGAKVLAHDAIRLAKEKNVLLHIKKTGDDDVGTRIEKDVSSQQERRFALTHLRALIRFSIPLHSLDDFKNRAGYFLCGAQLGDNFVGYISNDISQEMVDIKSAHIDRGLALITVHLMRNQFAFSVLSEIKRTLFRHDITLHDLLVGHNEIFLVIDDSALKKALTSIHKQLVEELL